MRVLWEGQSAHVVKRRGESVETLVEFIVERTTLYELTEIVRCLEDDGWTASGPPFYILPKHIVGSYGQTMAKQFGRRDDDDGTSSSTR